MLYGRPHWGAHGGEKMTEQLAAKLKKPFKFIHHLGYVIFILSFIIPLIVEKFFRISVIDDYFIYWFLIAAICCFLLVPSNYIDVYEDRNNLQFKVGRYNPTANLGWALFCGIILLLLFLFFLLEKK